MSVNLDNSTIERLLQEARRDALTDAARTLNGYCMANSPVDTGNLRRSHRVSGPDAAATEIHVVATAGYSLYVHEGHRIVAWGNETGRIQPPNPWLTRSVDQMAAAGAF